MSDHAEVDPWSPLKLLRADEHLEALSEEIKWWVGSEPYRILHEEDAQTRIRTVSVEPFGNPPLKLSLLVGDAVQNLRSALDHLALALAESNVGGRVMARVEEDSQFPIYSSKSKWRAGRSRRVGCASARAQAVMQRLQPYRRGDAWTSHPLWLLRQLSDFDKHRRVPLVGMYANLAAASIGQGNVSIGYLEIHGHGGPLERKTPLLSFRDIVEPTTGAEVDVNYTVGMQVAFSEHGPSEVAGKNVLDEIAAIRNYVVGEAVANLQPLL